MFFLFNGNPVFNNEPRNLPRNPPDCTILHNWDFDSLILTNELFVKALRRFATCLLPNCNLCGKLVSLSELPITFNDNLKTASVSFFIGDLNFLS